MSGNYSLDLQRYNIGGGGKPKGEVKRALTYLRHLRAVQESKNKFVKAYHKRLLIRMSLKYGIRIFPWMSIGPGLYIGHPRDINVNVKATIGRNCNIHRGAVVGIANRGRLMGAPTIGDEVCHLTANIKHKKETLTSFPPDLCSNGIMVNFLAAFRYMQ